MTGVLVIFDFDKTIIDCDSDNWVLDQMGATERFNRLRPSMQWNPLMDMMMTELHSSGRTIGDIMAALKRTPIHPRVITAIRSAHALGCDLKIVSDANRFFIETILDHHGLSECFSDIFTNPGFVDAEGRLRITPFHDGTHGCSLCPPNMCKGLVIERIQASEGKRFIYLGDGAGDLCPSLKLGKRDYVMPRKNFPVWDLICSNSDRLKAEIHEWCSGEDMEPVLLGVIAAILNGHGSMNFISECNLMTTTPHGRLPQPRKIKVGFEGPPRM